MMFLTNTTPTKQARNICLVKRGYRQIELYGCRLCYTWQFRATCNAIPCNAIIDLGRCYFKCIGCKILSVVHILLSLLPQSCTLRNCNYRK